MIIVVQGISGNYFLDNVFQYSDGKTARKSQRHHDHPYARCGYAVPLPPTLRSISQGCRRLAVREPKLKPAAVTVWSEKRASPCGTETVRRGTVSFRPGQIRIIANLYRPGHRASCQQRAANRSVTGFPLGSFPVSPRHEKTGGRT